MRFCYADPPYPGLARKYYGREDSYGGEVDHAALVTSLRTSGYDGWALSTSSKALRDVLPLCPEEAEVAAWVKPTSGNRTRRNHWEAVIVVRGRASPPGSSDVLFAQPARGGGTLMGRKPLAFCAWLFDLLGMRAGDELVDLFPGTGVVARAWAEVCRAGASARAQSDALPRGPSDALPASLDDACPTAPNDGRSLEVLDDASQEYLDDGTAETGGRKRCAE